MLLFTDGFDSYAATADMTKKWASNSNTTNVTWNSTAGRYGAGAVSLVTSGNLASFLRATANDTFCFAFWFKASAKPSASNLPFIWMLDNSNSFNTNFGPCASLALNASSGAIGYRVWAGALSCSYGTIDVCDNAFHWIEYYFKGATSGGRTKVVIDGTVDIDFTGNAGNAAAMDRYAISGQGGTTITIDDFIVWDNQAGTLTGDLTTTNFPIGTSRIETLRPSAAGSSTQWTPSAGSNFQCVDETVPNGDTDYVNVTTSNQKDLYAFGNLSATPSAVVGVVVNAYAKNATSGNMSLKGTAHSGASDSTSAATTVPSAYRTLQFNIPQDPNTSAAWTGAGVDGAEFGVQSS